MKEGTQKEEGEGKWAGSQKLCREEIRDWRV